MNPTTALALGLVWPLLGCGGGAALRAAEADKRKEELRVVQAAACLLPATESACLPGVAVDFEAPRSGSGAEKRTGRIWCEEGRPHAHLSSPAGDVTGEFGQVVWEAIWRVLDATGSCASAYGGAVSVTRDGQTRRCADPRFDMRELFDAAYHQAKQGPPRAVKSDETSFSTAGICEIDPQACQWQEGPCPVFRGDPWSGVRAQPEEGADSGPDESPGVPEEPTGPDDAPQTPSPAEVTKALAPAVKQARACLKVDSPAATAALLFQSSGTVQTVTVKGSEGPAGSCIEAALRKTHIPSFSGPSYRVGVTIRPPG